MRPVIFGDREQSQDYTFIDDVVEANIFTAEGDVSGEVSSVAFGDQVTVNELVTEINEILRTEPEPVYDDLLPGDVRFAHADISKIRKEVGYEPVLGIREGLEEKVAGSGRVERRGGVGCE